MNVSDLARKWNTDSRIIVQKQVLGGGDNNFLFVWIIRVKSSNKVTKSKRKNINLR